MMQLKCAALTGLIVGECLDDTGLTPCAGMCRPYRALALYNDAHLKD